MLSMSFNFFQNLQALLSSLLLKECTTAASLNFAVIIISLFHCDFLARYLMLADYRESFLFCEFTNHFVFT